MTRINKKYHYKIIIKGSYGECNFGDDALMIILFDYLKNLIEPADIAFFCNDAPYLSKLIPEAQILNAKVQQEATAELFLFGGGTQFYSFQKDRTILRKVLSIVKSAIKRIKQEKQYGHIAALGVGVGPFLDSTAEYNTKKQFSLMDHVSVRDKESYKYLKKWKIGNASLHADFCYLLDNCTITPQREGRGKNNIGIIVRDWNHTEDGAAYYDNISKLSTELDKRGYRTTLIIFSKKSDQFWMKKMQQFKNTLVWEPESETFESFIMKLSCFDLFVTARFHGAIFSILLKKPFVSIVVEDKLEIIADEYPGSSRKWSYPFDVSECISHVDEVSRNSKQSLEEFQANYAVRRDRAVNMLNEFTAFLSRVSN